MDGWRAPSGWNSAGWGVPNLIFAEEFNSALDLASSSTITTAKWLPAPWYIDLTQAGFGGVGGADTFNVNPNVLTTYNPFSVASSVLTISATKTPADSTLRTSMQSAMTAQGTWKTSTVTFSGTNVTWTAHGLAVNTRVNFTTTGTLPAAISVGTVYFIVSVAANTFTISATRGGTAITFSGGSGTHTAVKSIQKWLGGYLVSNPREQKFRYGYFEFRARWPVVGVGMFPAIWLYSADGSSDTRDRGQNEIDLCEIFGQATGTPFGVTLHKGANTGTVTDIDLGSNGLIDPTAFNVFGLDWQPGYMRMYCNDHKIAEAATVDANYYIGDMSIIINNNVDAVWFANAQYSDGTTPDPLTMEIDYIRAYVVKPRSKPTVQINFGSTSNAAEYVTASNRTSGTVVSLNQVYPAWTMTVGANWNGTIDGSAGNDGMASAGPAGIDNYTAEAHKTGWSCDQAVGVGTVTISGLEIGRTYRISVLGSRNVTGTRTTRYTLTSGNSPAPQDVNSASNINTLALFTGVQPQAGGSVVLTVTAITSFGYLNAMRITEE